MSMNRWDPLSDLLSIQERVNRLFEDTPGVGPGEVIPGGSWSPPMDVYETEAEFVVKAELPEMARAEIEIEVKDNVLAIEGERKFQRSMMEGYHRIERAYGRFQRSFLLPGYIDRENIKATLKDGILRIVLPKKGGTTRRQIEITGT